MCAARYLAQRVAAKAERAGSRRVLLCTFHEYYFVVETNLGSQLNILLIPGQNILFGLVATQKYILVEFVCSLLTVFCTNRKLSWMHHCLMKALWHLETNFSR